MTFGAAVRRAAFALAVVLIAATTTQLFTDAKVLRFERTASPLLGKSYVVYARKDAQDASREGSAHVAAA